MRVQVLGQRLKILRDKSAAETVVESGSHVFKAKPEFDIEHIKKITPPATTTVADFGGTEMKFFKRGPAA